MDCNTAVAAFNTTDVVFERIDWMWTVNDELV